MIANFVNTADNKFTLNGIEYHKNYAPIQVNQSDSQVRVISAYDSRFQLVPPTHYSEYKVNGVTYNSVESLIHALVDVVFSKFTLDGVAKEFQDSVLQYVDDLQSDISGFKGDVNTTVNNFQSAVNNDLNQITAEKQAFESEAQEIKDAVANMTTTGKIYDSLADAIAESPKPEDGTPFSVMGDGDNDGYYKFDSTQPDGVKFGRKFDRRIQVESISQLKNYKGRPGEAVDVLGYYEKGDGGGGTFYWDAASTEEDNGGTVIESNAVADGRWKRRYEGAVNVRWFGAKGDGVADDTASITSAINTGLNIEVSEGSYLLTNEIPINGNVRITGDGKLKFDSSTVPDDFFATKMPFLIKSNINVSTTEKGDQIIPIDNYMLFDGNLIGKTLTLDFSKYKVEVVNKVIVSGQLRFRNFDHIEILNLNITGDSIYSDGSVINTDEDYSFLLIYNCKNLSLKNSTIKDVRGSAITISNCEKATVRNCHIENATYNNIKSDTTESVFIYDCTLKGLGKQATPEENIGLGAGISLNIGKYALVKGCTILETVDTAIQMNGFQNNYIINNYVDGFGKDGVKIMRSPVFLNYGESDFGVISGNIIKNKFEGKTDGSAYIMMNEVRYGIVSNNTTIKGDDPKDDYNFDWNSITCSLWHIFEGETHIKCHGNILHNNVKIYGYDNIDVSNNDIEVALYVLAYSNPLYPNDIKQLAIENNTIKAEPGKVLRASVQLNANIHKAHIAQNKLINNNGSSIVVLDMASEGALIIDSNSIESRTNATYLDFSEIKDLDHLSLTGNTIKSMDVATGFYSPFVAEKCNLNRFITRDNVITSVRPISSEIDGSDLVVEMIYSEGNLVNDEEVYAENTKFSHIKRLLGNQCIKYINTTVFIPENTAVGDRCLVYYNGEYFQLVYNGSEFVTESTTYVENSLLVKNLKKFTNGQLSIYDGTNWVTIGPIV